jgi:hypothetical protein
MGRPVLSRRERCQDAPVDAWLGRELREANRQMHDFLAVLGHELRSPLAAICTLRSNPGGVALKYPVVGTRRYGMNGMS